MKRKVFCFLLAVLAIAIFSLGCGGGGGSHSNPASPSISSTARVSGVIVDSSKKPAENVDVRLALVSKSNLNALPENFRAALRLATADTQTEFNTTTDKNGVYSFENVPYGRYSLSADAGTQGAYVANLVVAAEDITVQEQTLTPFGFVSGTVITNNGKNDIQVYGAMVNAGEKAAFTNNEGKFTLSHIPVGVKYELVTTLQGYEATETTTFTIPATGTLTLELENPIVIKPIQSENYSVKASVTGIGNVELPIYVIAQHSSIKDKIYFNTIKENPDKKTTLECSVNIVDAGDYNIFALSADRKETKAISFSTSASDKSVTLDFESETDNEIKVNIVKITNIPEEINESTVTNEKLDSSYFDGYVSDYGPGDDVGGWTYSKITDYPSHSWIANENGELRHDKVYLYGNSIAYYTVGEYGSANIIWQTGNDEEGDALYLPSQFSGYGLNTYGIKMAFIPGEFISVGYQYDCSNSKVFLEVYKPEQLKLDTPTPCVKILHNDESNTYAPDFRMAKDDVKGDCYLAAMISSGDFYGLKIYNVTSLSNTGSDGTTGTTVSAVVENASIQPDKMKKFQVLKDASNNTLFYVEGSNSSGTEVQSYVIDSSSQIKYSDTSNKSCYIDGEGSMYRYVPATETTSGSNDDSSKIIKITSPFNSAQYSATTTLDLVNGSSANENISGILGFNEDSSTNTLTIFVY